LAGKGLARAIPFIGIVISGAANKTLTSRVGKSVLKALDGRAAAKKAGAPGHSKQPKPKPRPARSGGRKAGGKKPRASA
ncbi:MAG: hypothetical protein HY901_16195, partial [Deltaproteobacteria bacterium]|nr:hypothetical protein [Deltaproteobacteria bacterium]